MITDRNIAPGAFISATKIQGILPEGPVIGDVFHVAKSGLQARTWLDGRVPASNLQKTIGGAIAKSKASRGDVIYIAPGHTETLAAAGDVTANMAGVSIIGLGNGNFRPTFNFSTTDATVAISAANVTIKNIITTNTIDEVVSMFNVTGAGVTLDQVDFVPTTGQAIQFLLTTAAADQLTIKNCIHRQATAANSAQKWIQVVGADHTRIVNNLIQMTANASTGSHAISGSTALVDCQIAGNTIIFLGATVTIIINLVTGSTGVIHNNNLAGGAAVLLAAAITGDGCFMFENYVTNSVAASGIVGPAVDVVT